MKDESLLAGNEKNYLISMFLNYHEFYEVVASLYVLHFINFKNSTS